MKVGAEVLGLGTIGGLGQPGLIGVDTGWELGFIL